MGLGSATACTSEKENKMLSTAKAWKPVVNPKRIKPCIAFAFGTSSDLSPGFRALAIPNDELSCCNSENLKESARI